MPQILVLNGGSSSTKFALFEREGLAQICRGESDDLPSLLEDYASQDLAAIGQRIVHGGPRHRAPELLDDAAMAALHEAIPLAPDHLPDEIEMIMACRRSLPGIPQFACYDTWFHRTLPRTARLFALPRRYAEEDGILRFGFHGVSYEWIAGRLRDLRPEAGGRAVVAHLGGGASLAALACGICVDTTMGFTPTGGLVMGTRPGDLDPGILLYLLRKPGMSVEKLEHVLQKESGLAGLSGGISDMRRLLQAAADDTAAEETIQVFCRRAAQGIAAMATSLGGLDTLVFTGGIGEHLAPVRRRICNDLGWMGVNLDMAANDGNAARVEAAGAVVQVHVIPTDEERQIAQHVDVLLKGQ